MAPEEYTQQLLAKKNELESLMAKADKGSSSVQLDQTKVGRLSRMDALQSQAMSKEVDRRRQVELNRIDAALQRIAEGEFGFCITCGHKIEKARLALNPSLPQCSKCASG